MSPSKPTFLGIHFSGLGTDHDRELGNLYTGYPDLEGSTDPLSGPNTLLKFNTPDLDVAKEADLKPDQFIFESVSTAETSIDPYKSGISWNTLNFEFRDTDENLKQFRHVQSRPDFVLTSELGGDPSDTTIDTDANGGQLENKIIHIAEETLFVEPNSHQGGGTYDNVVRKLFLSPRMPHEKEAGIYKDHIPYWEGRKVRLFVFSWDNMSNAGGSQPEMNLKRRYVGLIDEFPGHDHARIVFRTNHAGSYLNEAKVNRDPLTWNDFYSRPDVHTDQDSSKKGVRMEIGIKSGGDRDGKSKVFKESDWDNNERTFFRLNELLVAWNGASYRVLRTSANTLFNTRNETPDRLPFGKKQKNANAFPTERIDTLKEPLVINKQFDEDSNKTYSATRRITDSTNHDDDYIYHPVSIVACFLNSTYSTQHDADNFDVLNGNWGLGMKGILSDGFVSDVRDLVDNDPENKQIDHLILGWDGSQVNIWDVCTNILESWGYTWSVQQDGRLTISNISTLDINTWDNAQVRSIDTEQSEILEVTESGLVDTINAKVGETPWNEARLHQFQINDASQENPRVPTRLRRTEEQTLDMRTVDTDNKVKAELLGQNKIELQRDRLPTLRMKCPDPDIAGSDYSLARFVVLNQLPLEQPWFTTKDGTVERLKKNDPTFAARIVGRRFLPKEGKYILTFQFSDTSIARWRSPSGIISDFDENAKTITLSTSGAMDGIDGEFVADDDIQIFTEDGALRATEDAEIDAINGDKMTLRTWPFSNSPQQGDVVEIAHFDTDGSGDGYSNTGIFNNVNRPYVALAQSDGTIGDEDIDADVYGG